jgi:hypothetical protein
MYRLEVECESAVIILLLYMYCSMYNRCYVDLYIHSPIRLHGVVLN